MAVGVRDGVARPSTRKGVSRTRPVPGPYSARLHRIIAVIAVLAALATDVLSIPSILARLAVAQSRPGALLVVPLVVLPLLVGVLVGLGAVLRRTGVLHDTPGPPAGAFLPTWDRVWHALVVVFVVWYPLLLAVVPHPGQGAAHVAPAMAADQDFVVSCSTPVVVASPLVLPRRGRFAYAVSLAPLSVLFLVRTGAGAGLQILQAPAFLLAFNLLFLAAATWVLDQAQRLDSAHRTRVDEETAVLTERARNLARRRMNDFVHDHVLSALVPVAGGLEDEHQVRSAARLALASMDGTTAGQDVSTSVALFSTLASRSRASCPDVRIEMAIDVDHAIPPDVGRAILDAQGEALTNSVRHAGVGLHSEVTRRVVMTSDARGVRVVVGDDGRGFDPTAVAAGRRGIRHSILRRMHEAGAHALIDPGEGRGTRVELAWYPLEGSLPGEQGTDPTEVGAETEPARGTSPWGVSVASSMQTLPARVVSAWAVVAHVLLVVANVQVYTHLAPVVGALLAQVLAAVLLLRDWPEARLPRWATVTTTAVVGASNLAVLLVIPGPGWPGYAAWSLGSSTMLCWGLLMRERRGAAWTGWLLLLLTSCIWVLRTGQPVVLALSMTVGHLATIALWDLVATWSARAAKTIAADDRRQVELAAERRAEDEAGRLIEDTMASVGRRARPLLEEVAEGAELTPALRLRARLLEAELRDEIRAPCFTGTPVVDAAREARARGLEVVLLDDGAERSAGGEFATILVPEVVRALDTAEEGRVVVRVLPPGRGAVATVVGGGKHLSLASDGSVRSD